MAEAAQSLWQRLWYTRLRDAVRGRLDASLDWRRELAAIDLPDELRQVVHQTVHATRLWNRERIDVARELAAHFQDGLERGRPVRMLAATFGDPKRTAALIRSAKIRGRSNLWHTWHYGWMTVAALVAVYLLMGLYMMTGRPTIKVDFLAIINRDAERVPAAERAWPLYRDALLAMHVHATPGNYDPTRAIPNLDAQPGDANWPKLEQFLRKHADAVAKLRDAAGRPSLGFVLSNSHVAFAPEDRQLFGVTITKEQIDDFKTQTAADHWLIATLLPHLYQLKVAAMLLSADAKRAANAGDAETSLADVVTVYGISRHVQEAPFLVNLLVAIAVQEMAVDAIRDVMMNHSQLWSNGRASRSGASSCRVEY